MMILRVYAMWNRSRKTLGALLFIYVVQIITSFVIEGIYNNPNTYISGTSHDKSLVSIPPQTYGLTLVASALLS